MTGWQLLALRAAKNVGCDVPADAIDRAVAYVRRCYDDNRGTFTYTVRGPSTVACAGTGILGLELCGRELHRCRESLRAGAYIIRSPLSFEQSHCFYGLYYCSQAMFHSGTITGRRTGPDCTICCCGRNGRMGRGSVTMGKPVASGRTTRQPWPCSL